MVNFGKVYEVIDSEEKEWFGKKGGKKPRKGPAKKKAVKGAKDAPEEGIWTDDIWTYTQEEWDTVTSEELCKIKEGQIVKMNAS